jgi:hypothetical protein
VKRAVAASVSLTVGLAAYLYWFSDERQIRRLLDDVASSVSQEEAMGVTGMTEIAGLRTLLAPDVLIDPGPPYRGIVSGPEDVIAAVTRLRIRSPFVLLTFVDVEVSMDGSDAATVHATAKLSSRTTEGDQHFDAREVVLSIARRDGRWVLTAAKSIPVLDPVALR